MTKTALKKKIIEYMESTDNKILEAVYTILDEHAKAKNDTSLLSREQKNELDRRMKLFEEGKMQVSEWSEVYKKLKKKHKN